MPNTDFRKPWQPQRLTELQPELECIAVEYGNVLVRIPCTHPDDIPRVLVVNTVTRTGYTSGTISRGG